MMNKMMKKLAVLFTIGALAVAGSVVSVNANDGMSVRFSIETVYGTRTCCVDGANIRTEPSTNGAIIGGLSYGEVVNISGVTDNGWVLLADGGYVRADLLTTETITPANDNVNPDYTWIKETHSSNSSRIKAERGYMSHDNDTFTVNVASGYLALRSSAVTDPSNEIAQLSNGSMVHVQSYGEQFDYVYVPSLDMYGYVNNDYLIG